MFRFAATSALAIGVAFPALADVTPAQVWDDLQATYKGYGYDVTGTVEDTGGTLTVRDAVFSTGGEGGATTISIPQLSFRETGDARVRMVIEGDLALDSTVMVPAPAEDEPADAPAEGADGTAADTPPAPEMVEMTTTGTIRVPGNETVVSGAPGDMVYDFRYPSLAFDLRMPVDPESGETMPVTGTLGDVAGTQRRAGTAGAETSFDVTASEATMEVAAADPGATADGGTATVRTRLSDLTGSGTARTPSQDFDLGTQMAEALASGLDFRGSFGFGAGEIAFDFRNKTDAGEDESGNGTVTLGAGTAALQLSAQGLGYKGEVADSKAEMTVSSLSFPVSYAADRTGFDLLIPVSKADAAQPFRFAYALEGLTFADEIWNQFDPENRLPRDPASLTVDLSGDAMVTENLFDPMTAQDDGATPPEAPFAPKTLAVNKVALDAAGARADITGALDFGDNPNEPVGKLNGTFAGVNGLMDKLVAMGLVPQEQAMGLRMMLAMFAKPVEGNPDQLTSEIEFREGGSIFANGQQVR